MKLVSKTSIPAKINYDIEVEDTNCFFANNILVHNSNAGICRTVDGRFIPQSRERVISVDSDNAGFAFFVDTHKEAIKALFDRYPVVDGQELTLYGEWCGGNIQKKVALNEVPKHLVLFAAKYSPINPVFDENEPDGDRYPSYCDLLRDLHDNENGIYNIYQIPTYEVTVDFLNPEPASIQLADLTLEVEKECPWVKFLIKNNIKECIYYINRIEWLNDTKMLNGKFLKEIEININNYAKDNNLIEGSKLTFQVL